jgi:hypothetical protein
MADYGTLKLATPDAVTKEQKEKVDSSFAGAIRQSFVNPTTPETLRRLEKLTGLKADAINFYGSPYIKLKIPQGVDREAYVDKFIDARNKAGVSRDQMSVVDNIDGGTNHDPKAFYLPADSVTPTVLTKLEGNTGAFSAFPQKKTPIGAPTPK